MQQMPADAEEKKLPVGNNVAMNAITRTGVISGAWNECNVCIGWYQLWRHWLVTLLHSCIPRVISDHHGNLRCLDLWLSGLEVSSTRKVHGALINDDGWCDRLRLVWQLIESLALASLSIGGIRLHWVRVTSNQWLWLCTFSAVDNINCFQIF